MTHLLKKWNTLKKGIKSKNILLLLDYDGTLTPIVSRPSQAKLSSSTRRLLYSLSKKKNITLGIISGRRLNELEGLVKVPGIYYAGNHGFQIKGPAIDFIHPQAEEFKACKQKVKSSLKSKAGNIKGIILEDKSVTLSFHYRLVDKQDEARARRLFYSVCRKYQEAGKIKITAGKKILEVRPPIRWNKANAVDVIRMLAAGPDGGIAIYAGDDRTDEDAFKALRKKDIPVLIGQGKKSAARYFLKDTKEVEQFLRRL